MGSVPQQRMKPKKRGCVAINLIQFIHIMARRRSNLCHRTRRREAKRRVIANQIRDDRSSANASDLPRSHRNVNVNVRMLGTSNLRKFFTDVGDATLHSSTGVFQYNSYIDVTPVAWKEHLISGDMSFSTRCVTATCQNSSNRTVRNVCVALQRAVDIVATDPWGMFALRNNGCNQRNDWTFG